MSKFRSDERFSLDPMTGEEVRKQLLGDDKGDEVPDGGGEPAAQAHPHP